MRATSTPKTMLYTPPTTEQLADLKQTLGLTGKQMAELFGLAGDHQWRKYTGGQQPREVSPQMLFFAMARLELDEATISRILQRMRSAGATIDLSGAER
ncbi:XRE family transcriptional regulator [Cupriavidus sp. D384]|uniref:XRE family transcriptional regulator n=1 Tax=Cupriavidus sp. D384 TaxID=1538095 RepID=UPI000AFD5012